MDVKGGNLSDVIRRRYRGSPPPQDFSPRGARGDLPPDFMPKPPWKPASVLVPVVERPEGHTLLLTRRTERLQDHAGQVSFPGGGREASDADPVATALRETEEEVGLGRRHVEVVGYLPGYLTVSAYAVTPVVGLVTPDFRLSPDPLEVAEIFEVPFLFLADPLNRQVMERDFAGHRVSYYQFDYQGHVIWGATAAMLVGFMDTLAEEAGR